MKYRIETIGEKKLAGKRMKMSLSQNRTAELWRSFMSQKKEIKKQVGTDLYSIQLYNPSYFNNFNPKNEFEKWAAIEVVSFDALASEIETFSLPVGLYAVFLHKGAAQTAPETFQYIFGAWLPNSDNILDDRPHFEILGEKYKNDDPASEEEIWIPVKIKPGLLTAGEVSHVYGHEREG